MLGRTYAKNCGTRFNKRVHLVRASLVENICGCNYSGRVLREATVVIECYLYLYLAVSYSTALHNQTTYP